MTKEDIVRAYARESLGCPYIYGATGQPCTPSYRRARMQQYPSYALTIQANCQQLKSYKTTCEGCRWARDGVGRLAYDCAQLTRCALAAAGIALPAGLNEKEEENMELYEVTGKQLALRDAPTLSGAVLTRLKTGTVVSGGESGTEGWLTVTAGGLRGYCMAQYLQKEAAEPENGDVLEHLYTAYRQLRAAIEMAGGSV